MTTDGPGSEGSPRRRGSRRAPTPGSASDLGGLRWSVFTVGDNLAGEGRRSRRPQEILDYVAEAERLGYWGFFFAEHHFDPHGEVPDPWLLVAAAAERTSGGSLRLGPMVSNLSFRDPVRVAEQALWANRLSEDRIEVGIGSGNVLQEHLAFGLHPDPLAQKRERFDRAFPLLLSTLRTGSAPAPHLPAGSVQIPLAPIAPADGRIWVATGRSDAAVRFAESGCSVALGPPFATMGDLSDLSKLVREIRQRLPSSDRLRIAAAFPVYVGPEPEKGRSALDRFLLQKQSDGSAHLPAEARGGPNGKTSAELVRGNLAIIGTPGEAAVSLAAVRDSGITDFLAIPDFGGMDPPDVRRTLREVASLAGLQPRGR